MCGILGICNFSPKKPIQNKIQEQLQNLQHRGQDSYGYYLVNSETENTHIQELGTIQEHSNLKNSHLGIGHTRYATSYQKDKKSNLENKASIQPVSVSNQNNERIVFCFNGNLNNLDKIARTFALPYTPSTDTEVLKCILENYSPLGLENLLERMLKNIRGVFNLLVIDIKNEYLYGLKDLSGNRPLCLGQNESGICLASESVALGEYEYQRELEAGEIICISKDGCRNVSLPIYQSPKTKIKFDSSHKQVCLFEYIYLQKKDSLVNEKITVEDLRVDFGEELARQETLKIDKRNKNDMVVVGAPNTGIPIGQSYARCLDISYCQFMKKRRGALRSFIKSNNSSRLDEIKRKFEIDSEFSIQDKIVFFVDDSLVRGNTISIIIQLLLEYKPREIHFRIASPEVKNPCYFGVDIPTSEELIMNHYTVEELTAKLGVTSLKFLQTDSMSYVLKKKLGLEADEICQACFTGKYSPHLDF